MSTVVYKLVSRASQRGVPSSVNIFVFPSDGGIPGSSQGVDRAGDRAIGPPHGSPAIETL